VNRVKSSERDETSFNWKVRTVIEDPEAHDCGHWQY